MNVQQPDSVVAKRAALKALRTAVRLKYSLMADAELNRRLPELEDRIDVALDSGKPLELTVGEIVDEV
jgi:hypothetical protein